MSVYRFSLFCIFFVCGALASPPCEPGYVDDYVNGCQPCSPGSHDTGSGSCLSCQADTYQPLAGQMECIPCPPNSNSLEGDYECVVCPEGQAVMEWGGCGVCPPGQYYDFGYCHECNHGFFKAETGIHPCLPCPQNSYSRQSASECIPCPEGQALMTDGSCGTCPPGKYYESYAAQCFDCYPRTYTDFENIMPFCYNCGGNSFSPEGSSECFECPVGKVYIGSTQTCDSCEPGEFYDEQTLSCKECRYNSFTVLGNEVSCRRCMPGTFARPGSSTCFTCPRRQVYLSETDDCGVCVDKSYDHYEAQCGYDDYYYETPLPEPSEGPMNDLPVETTEHHSYETPFPDPSYEAMNELPVETTEEESSASDVPGWDISFASRPEDDDDLGNGGGGKYN